MPNEMIWTTNRIKLEIKDCDKKDTGYYAIIMKNPTKKDKKSMAIKSTESGEVILGPHWRNDCRAWMKLKKIESTGIV